MHRLLFALLLIASPVGAAVFSRDLYESGDGLLTYDDVNQREWLDFSVTAGLSFDELALLISPVGPLAGFQLATKGDTYDLFKTNDVMIQPGVANDWAGLLGNASTSSTEVHENTVLVTSVGGRTSQGMDGDDEAYSVSFTSQIQFPTEYRDYFETVSRPYVFSYYPQECVDAHGPCLVQVAIAQDFGGPRGVLANIGPPPELSTYWLYRDAAHVPEPAGLCLAAAACLAALRLRVLA